MDKKEVREAVLEAVEATLAAQLRAVKRLRSGAEERPRKAPQKGMSQVDMVADILRREGAPLHINQILERIAQHHQVRLDRESVVSALVKKVRRNERFVRSGKNVFGLKGGE